MKQEYPDSQQFLPCTTQRKKATPRVGIEAGATLRPMKEAECRTIGATGQDHAS